MTNTYVPWLYLWTNKSHTAITVLGYSDQIILNIKNRHLVATSFTESEFFLWCLLPTIWMVHRWWSENLMKLLQETLLTKNDFAESVFSSSSDFYWLHAKGFESLNAFDSSTQCDCVCFFLYIYMYVYFHYISTWLISECMGKILDFCDEHDDCSCIV